MGQAMQTEDDPMMAAQAPEEHVLSGKREIEKM